MINVIRMFEVSIGYYGSDEMTIIEGPWQYAETEEECEELFRQMNDGFLTFDKISIDRM